MLIAKLLFLNIWRNRTRSLLTLVGLVVSVLAFGLLSTVVKAWYAGAEAASQARLITRSSVSLIFPLPLSYGERIRGVDGVRAMTISRWFGGVYKDTRNFFPQFAVDPPSYFAIYPEYLLAQADRDRFYRDRRSAVVGRRLADQYGFRVGDMMTLKGQIFPGQWEFLIAGIYEGKDEKTDTGKMYFHWAYLNEEVKRRNLSREAESVGVFITLVDSPERAADVSLSIDGLFANSAKETLTETEQAFQLGFVAMTEAIVLAIRAVSFVVILIIMAVMANTMSMTARERTCEYATLKALGFSPGFVGRLIMGEALLVALVGGIVGIAITFPVASAFHAATGTLFKSFVVSPSITLMQLSAVLITGVVAGLWPAIKSSRIRIVEGLRAL
ncbi:MAG: FtsX-like permease family protein [Betaproteobacteria bacterium]|mgnify:CR=1 FL=1|nr:FtsX-like permease family protein [Betaproteobacteria bacterium]NBT75337.1 FtsX-like permease family protein [Betaproteobacteria bacterium]NBY13538.1 FtsX-like permease family protein [Betaproteobacteria bacterium]NCA16212.1 FtsX-like permease family protein [Betaproteobacteria bacterium]